MYVCMHVNIFVVPWRVGCTLFIQLCVENGVEDMWEIWMLWHKTKSNTLKVNRKYVCTTNQDYCYTS